MVLSLPCGRRSTDELEELHSQSDPESGEILRLGGQHVREQVISAGCQIGQATTSERGGDLVPFPFSALGFFSGVVWVLARRVLKAGFGAHSAVDKLWNGLTLGRIRLLGPRQGTPSAIAQTSMRIVLLPRRNSWNLVVTSHEFVSDSAPHFGRSHTIGLDVFHSLWSQTR